MQFNQDLYPSSGVPLTTTSTSVSSHSSCSPLLQPNLASSSSSSSSTVPTIISSLGQRHIAKEEDLSLPRNTDAEGMYNIFYDQILICILFWVQIIKLLHFYFNFVQMQCDSEECANEILTHVYCDRQPKSHVNLIQWSDWDKVEETYLK